MQKLKNLHPLSAMALGLSLMFTAPAEAGPISVIDDRGVVVTVEQEPKKIAAISYFAADTALALGLQPVASTYMIEDRNPDYLLDYLTDAKKLGQRASPNMELLADSEPDLIVAIRRYTEGSAKQFNAVAPYLAFNLETFGDSDRSILQMGSLLGKGTEASGLNEKFHADLAAHVEKIPEGAGPKYLFIWGGGESPWAYYNEHMTSALVTALGGQNISGSNPTPHVPDNTAYEMSLEYMLAQNPEVIFVYDYGPDRPFENNPIWSRLDAVKNGRVHFVKDHWLESHGPIARQMVLREAAHFLYPETFPEIDVRAEATKLIPATITN